MAMTLITTNSGTATTSSFTSSIDSTYKLYIFKFVDVNPATDSVDFSFQCNATDTADYNDILITSAAFTSSHGEDDSPAALGYHDENDLVQQASFQILADDMGNGADECCAGELFLFNPSSTTYVKHFYARFSTYSSGSNAIDHWCSGWLDDATAIDDIQFKMSSGDFDATIRMYGVA